MRIDDKIYHAVWNPQDEDLTDFGCTPACRDGHCPYAATMGRPLHGHFIIKVESKPAERAQTLVWIYPAIYTEETALTTVSKLACGEAAKASLRQKIEDYFHPPEPIQLYPRRVA